MSCFLSASDGPDVPAIIVSTEIDGDYVDVGDLTFTPGRYDTHTARFLYDKEFVRRGYAIEPGIALDSARHLLPGLPLAVEDAAPDAWGQHLLQRAERQRAQVEGRASRSLTPDLLLLAASDMTRQGALRFRTEQDGPFLSEGDEVPKMLSLEVLLEAAATVDADPNTQDWRAIQRLLATGTSGLGGARPKAAVRDDEGRLWLAKFSRIGDANDVPVWEKVALDIAERAGLPVPERRLVSVGGKRVLLVRRFDRRDDGSRVPYISARTLLDARDLGTAGDYGGRGIAGRLRRESPRANADLEQIWRQAALNLLINNTDNHLRNHGFLREGRGWTNAPVFDLDPNPDTGSYFATYFGGASYRLSGLRGLMEMAKDCYLSDEQARRVLDEVHQAVSGWDRDARDHGASEGEIELFHDAFTGVDEQVERMITPPGSTGGSRVTKSDLDIDIGPGESKPPVRRTRSKSTPKSTLGSFSTPPRAEGWEL